MDKQTVINVVGGGSVSVCALRLGYASKQAIYNWPKKFGPTLRNAIKLRMQAKRIPIPLRWKWK